MFAVTVAPSAREAQEQKRAARMATKKARTKALFDAAYDAGGGERGADKSQTYFDEWKAEMEVQAKVRAHRTASVVVSALPCGCLLQAFRRLSLFSVLITFIICLCVPVPAVEPSRVRRP